MTKQVNKKQNVKAIVKTTQKATNINNMEDVFNYINTLAKQNKNISLQKVTGYVALKYNNKTIMELHDKKRSIAHVTISNLNNAFKILQNAKAVTRVVPASYGWRLNTEALLKAECLNVITQVIDSLIVETSEQFNAKNNAKKQQKTA